MYEIVRGTRSSCATENSTLNRICRNHQHIRRLERSLLQLHQDSLADRELSKLDWELGAADHHHHPSKWNLETLEVTASICAMKRHSFLHSTQNFKTSTAEARQADSPSDTIGKFLIALCEELRGSVEDASDRCHRGNRRDRGDTHERCVGCSSSPLSRLSQVSAATQFLMGTWQISSTLQVVSKVQQDVRQRGSRTLTRPLSFTVGKANWNESRRT